VPAGTAAGTWCPGLANEKGRVNEVPMHWIQRATRVIFYTGSAFFFAAALLHYLRGAGINPEYLLAGALMAAAPPALDWADSRFGPGRRS